MQWVEPNSVNEYESHYDDPATSGYVLPNDGFYEAGECRYVNDLGIDTSPWVPFGPASEYAPNWFSRQVVAVVDDGVYRDHPDSLFI